MPSHEGEKVPDTHTPEQLRWNRISTFTEGAKVFVGGLLKKQNDRLNFVNSKGKPLMVIFYNCPDAELAEGIIRCSRMRNEYLNSLTPISLAIGMFTLIYIASEFLYRPAFRLTAITALVAIFVPILPMIPPGLLFTVLYRRLTWKARKLRINRDLASFDLLPGSSPNTARRYAIRAYAAETLAWLILLFGIGINIIFIILLFRVISF